MKLAPSQRTRLRYGEPIAASHRPAGRRGAPVARRSRVIPGLMVLVCAAALSLHAQSTQSLRDELNAAAAAEQAGHYEQAAGLYQHAVSSPEFEKLGAAVTFEVRTRLATDFFLLHRYQDSLDAVGPVTSTNASAAIASPQAWLVVGLDRLELGQIPGAEVALRKTLALNPASGTARLALGDALARSGRMAEAAREYQEQTRRTPTQADAWYKLGLAYAQLSTQVAADFAQAHPDVSAGQLLTAEEALDRGDDLNAARGLFKLLRASPAQPEANADLGAALLELGYPKTAEERFRLELEQNPECPRAKIGLAETATLRGNWAEVRSALEDVNRDQPRELQSLLQLQPPGALRDAWRRGTITTPAEFAGSPAGRVWKAWLAGADPLPAFPAPAAAGACRRPSAKAEATPGVWLSEDCYRNLRRTLRERKSLSERERLKLAEAEYRLGEFENARGEAARLLQADPSSGWAAYWLSQAYGMLAQDCLDNVTAQNPNSARVHEMLAHYWTGRRFFPRAQAEFEAAIRLAPDLPDLHLGLATVYMADSKWNEADAELTRTLQLAPGSVLAEFELGDAYVQEQRYDLAVPHLKKAAADPGLGQKARLDLAEAEAATGATAEAVADLEALASNDSDGQIHYRLARLYRKLGDKAKERDALARFKQLQAASLQAGSGELLKLDEERQVADQPAGAAPP